MNENSLLLLYKKRHSNIDNNLIVLDRETIQETLDNWDGYIHSEVKETNNAFNKQIIDRKQYEKKR